MPKTNKSRDETKYALLAPVDAETYAGLKANISINGVQVPIVRDEKGYILDGFARAKIAKELGYECPSVVVKGLSEQEKRSQVRALNLSRRQLDQRAKREIIAAELSENPRRSNRWIGKSLGVDDKTVASVRIEMQSTAEIPQLGHTLGTDGKYRPATRDSCQIIGNGNHKLPQTSAGDQVRDHLDPEDEESILRAADAIRRRRISERNRHQVEKEEEARGRLPVKRLWTVTDDSKVVRCDLLIIDPPFGVTQEPWEPEDVEGFTRDWSRRWSGCGADFVAIFWSQARLWEGRKWFDESLRGYEFQQMLIWHANNGSGPRSRMTLKSSWYPILLYRRRGSSRPVFTQDKSWDIVRQSIDCHVAAVPQTVFKAQNSGSTRARSLCP